MTVPLPKKVPEIPKQQGASLVTNQQTAAYTPEQLAAAAAAQRYVEAYVREKQAARAGAKKTTIALDMSQLSLDAANNSAKQASSSQGSMRRPREVQLRSASTTDDLVKGLYHSLQAET
jgi:3-hydroxyisobutyrate dehydrogenase-like beta-hydroxyacid dehydrogenase